MAAPRSIATLVDQAGAAPVWEKSAAAGTVLVLVLLAFRALSRKARSAGREKVISGLVNTAALMATAVQASGMWKFFGNTMSLPVGFRIFMFSFMEIALLACGMRARANVEKGGDAGIDGALVWVLALASGLMSSTDASTFREALMRILVSVVVALLWTRDLMAAKQVARKTGAEQRPAEKVRWRVRPDRIAVWLRLADAVDTTVVTVESARQVAKFLRVTDRERDGRQWPFTVKARAYRGRMRMISEALRHGDPTEVHRKLSAAAFAEAMNRLGVAPDAGPDQTGEPDRSVAKPTGPDDNGDRSDTGPVSPAGPVQQTGQHDRSEDEDRPVRPVQPRPVSPKPDRSARPVKPTGPTGSTPLEELEEVCRAWAKANNVDPARMSRAKVAKVVRDAGYSCSTDRAGNVQELLDPKGATSEMERRLTGPTGPGGAR